jgi:hexulose-6-phosphate isomerase
MQRKEFIKASAGLVGLSMVNHLSITGATKKSAFVKPDIKICLKYGMVKGNMSILEKFQMLKDIGFDGVEMDSPNNLNNDEVIEASKKTGLEIPGVINSVHWKSPMSHPDEKVRAKCVEAMKTSLNDCKAYGGTTVLLVPGVVNNEVSYDDAYKRSQEEIRKLIPYAEETGIKIAIENVWNNFLISPIEAARYIDELDSKMVGWYFDVGNIVRYGWPEQWIRILDKRIMRIDAKEYSRKKQSEEGIWKGFEVELMEGDCNWPAVMEALDDIGFNGWASAEVPGGDRKRLEDVSKRMQKIFKS